jgi:hypothetical protein
MAKKYSEIMPQDEREAVLANIIINSICLSATIVQN